MTEAFCIKPGFVSCVIFPDYGLMFVVEWTKRIPILIIYDYEDSLLVRLREIGPLQILHLSSTVEWFQRSATWRDFLGQLAAVNLRHKVAEALEVIQELRERERDFEEAMRGRYTCSLIGMG